MSSTLKSLRQKRGLTQVQLAEILHVSQSSISQYEAKETFPSEDLLSQIAQFFGVSISYLLNDPRSKEVEDLLMRNYVEEMSVEDLVKLALQIPQNKRRELIDYMLFIKSGNSKAALGAKKK